MRSYFLEHLADLEAARRLRDETLPVQREPWLVLAGAGDPLAYVHVEATLDGQPHRS